MAPSSTSYLQTLPKSEATAFVASLQKVKEHLDQELQWMNEQVQQKTTQLDGIETLLSEAAALGLLSAEAASTKVSKPKAAPAPETNGTAEAAALLANLPSISTKDVTPAAQATDLGAPAGVASAVAPAPTRKTSSTQKKAKATKTQKKKPAAAKSVSAVKGKPGKPTTKPAAAKPAAAKPATPAVANGSKSPGSAGSQLLFKSEFRDVPVIDAVGEILKRAKTAVSADDVIDQLYEGVPDKDYKRIKHSISNVLSLGKSKKRWKSTGRGMYAI